MLRILFYISLCFLTQMSYGEINQPYQVDLIVFINREAELPKSTPDHAGVLSMNTHNAIPLQNDGASTALYHLLPISVSDLGREYWTLNHNPQYQIIAYYSWLQPSNNQRAIKLSAQNASGWNLEGTLRIRQSNYYLLDTNLVFTALSHEPISFRFEQKQRLKPATVYYLDHPNAGILIKVHQIK